MLFLHCCREKSVIGKDVGKESVWAAVATGATNKVGICGMSCTKAARQSQFFHGSLELPFSLHFAGCWKLAFPAAEIAKCVRYLSFWTKQLEIEPGFRASCLSSVQWDAAQRTCDILWHPWHGLRFQNPKDLASQGVWVTKMLGTFWWTLCMGKKDHCVTADDAEWCRVLSASVSKTGSWGVIQKGQPSRCLLSQLCYFWYIWMS